MRDRCQHFRRYLVIFLQPDGSITMDHVCALSMERVPFVCAPHWGKPVHWEIDE